MLTIGVDVGGTSIKSALIEVDESGRYEIMQFNSIPTEASGGRDSVIANIIKSIECFDWKACEHIAVATAGTVDWDSGEIIFATNTIPNYTGTKVSAELSRYFSRRVVVINDAVSALIAESCLGAGKRADSVMMFTIGTGLGASFLKDRVLDGSSVIDTRLGHMTLIEGGLQCSCGKCGCVEQYVSATALKRYGNDNLYQFFNSGDAVCKKILQDFYKGLANVASKAVELYSPSLIVVGGGVVEMSEYWWQNFLKEYKSVNSTPIVVASLGNKAGVLGSVYAMINGAFKAQ